MLYELVGGVVAQRSLLALPLLDSNHRDRCNPTSSSIVAVRCPAQNPERWSAGDAPRYVWRCRILVSTRSTTC